MTESVLVIGNPGAGDGTGPAFLEQHVLPLLKASNLSYDFRKTSSAEEAGELIRAHTARSTLPIVLAGGDGTVHDALNYIYLKEVVEGAGDSTSIPALSLILVPTGTANALYNSVWPPSTAESKGRHPLLPEDTAPETTYKLHSVLAFLDAYKSQKETSSSATSGRPIAIALAETFNPSAPSDPSSAPAPTKAILSCVVNSTSLHAGILHTAEKYRASMPGIERFKVAAQDNILNWSRAHVELVPPLGEASVLKYDPSTKQLSPSQEENGKLDGPFFYFLSTINVDRLEPQFVTTPLAQTAPPPDGAALDVVVVRPAHKPGYTGDSEESRKAFVDVVMAWFGAVYSNGTHLDHKYPESEVFMTEYYRVGGWKWFPQGSDEFSRLVCVDGTVLNIPEGGHAEVKVVPLGGKAKLQLWA
ncbi:hypothetical protein DL93DRAFT_2072752 [Clavulina sp. PMI_390]|nr:hypothetical protein DL93DRAFT_2072752 [Clavulina sp. PMI_390]